MDKQNYVIVEIDGEGQLVTKSFFLHNTKIISSKIGEDKDREKHRNKIQARCIRRMEMMHSILGYVEVVTNIEFIKISTMPLELHARVKIESDARKDDE